MYDFKFADIGEGIHEGKILKWNFKVGDKVKEGETLVIVETDKVNAELPSPVDGIIEKLGAEEGDTIHVGQTVVLINDGSKTEVKEEPKKEEKKAPVSEGKAAPGVIGEIEVSEDVMESSSEHEVKSSSTQTEKVLATPVARQLAKDLGVDIKTVVGTGENGRIMKEDIMKKAQSNKPLSYASPSNPEPSYVQPTVTVSVQGDVEYVPITKLRKAIVNSMTKSKQIIPHTTVMDEVAIDDLVELRNKVKEQAAAQNIKLTYMAFVMKAVVLSLKKFPMFNASFDQANDRMILKKFINLGMAVDTPDGLIVPNIKDADKKSILELAKELRDVANQTIDRKVQLSQLQNTTFSITNFGAANLMYGTPIINHPEVAILGVGRIEQRAVVENGQIVARYMMPLSLAVDHRVIDGADAGRFLTYFKSLLNDPMMLLLS